MANRSYHVFLSYSRNDQEAAALLRGQLERCGLSVFKDDERIRAGELWLDKLQAAVDGCGAFVVLVGRDGVRRWIGAEAQVALNRHFAPRDDAQRLPIFPILLDGIKPEMLPAFLRLFQITPWNGGDALPDRLLADIRDAKVVTEAVPFEGCPFVGLAAYRPDQAHLFFGRQKETLDALACFDTREGHAAVRWLEINGNSGSGKSSLMNAGLLPLIDQGWLWPRTGFAHWRRIGPMMPGARPVEMLVEALARAWQVEMADVSARFKADDDAALAHWLRTRKQDETAFLLAIDQFEELFTFADAEERRRFDRLLAAALEDPECPLFVVSTVRADFLDRFAEDLPRLVAAQNRLGRSWKLASIGIQALREVIQGPADLARLDVSEIKEMMVSEARDEPGALPLIENALHWLWQQRTDNRLSSRLFVDQGGLAGILTRGADDLLASLGEPQRDRALELLSRLVRVDREGYRHARQRLDLDEAVKAAGGGDEGLAVVHRLSGQRRSDGTPGKGPLRLITVGDGSVNVIHETLIRSKGLDAAGKAQPYWPTLWDYIEKNKDRAIWRERLREDAAAWLTKGRSAGHQWSHERVREAAEALRPMVGELSADEREFLGPMDVEGMLAELELPETTHKRRLLIGERLAVLSDPRRGVGVDADGIPEIDWCYVPGGDVTVSVLADPDRLYSKVADIYCEQVETFYIARYPVTVAQYRAFLEAENGFCNPAWWGPDLYRDANGNEYEFGRFGNHPAIYMSWFDAVAFCRWLSGRLGFAVRLPDEWEWQQAASSGNDRNAFPWGANWSAVAEPWRANTLESRLGQATAVGMYLAGATPTGILDMAGTVWEWCLNKFETGGIEVVIRHGEYDRDPRVVRGGCWGSSRGSASSFDRGRHEPIVRNGYIGFRIVCSSPIFRD